MHFAAEQQTAAALLPVGSQRRQVQHHEGAAGFAVGGCASEGRLEEVGELLRTRVSKKVRHFERVKTRQDKTRKHTFELR